MKNLFIFIALSLVSRNAIAQFTRFTIQLTDKNGSTFSLSNPTAFLSTASVQRRVRQNIAVDSTDLPVVEKYIDSISRTPGIRVIYTSRWLNNVLVGVTDSTYFPALRASSFIQKLTPVGLHSSTLHRNIISKNIDLISAVKRSPTSGASFRQFGSSLTLDDTLDYGGSYGQVHIHEGEFLHKLGFRGQGMTIAIIDAGFRNYQANRAFDSLRANHQILGEYDFVNEEASVNEDDSHGANCFAILASNIPGVMIGSAPKANYYLYKTEDVNSEKPIEEENWVVAAERADSAGADMISSSLGYSNFDDPQFNLNYAMRDGKTAPITIGANLAVRKGMIVTNSSGNSGELTNDYKYVMCPADGDDVIAVGSVDAAGISSPFSSPGPNGAGTMKPNIVSVGTNTAYANINGDLEQGSGTSYSNPNIAGLIACLWGANNDFTNREIIDAVQQSADKYSSPDTLYGYGIPNMRRAHQMLAAKRQAKLTALLNGSWINVYPNPFPTSFTVFLKAPSTGRADLRLFTAAGAQLQSLSRQLIEGNYYSIQITPNTTASGIYYLQYDDGKTKTLLKIVRL